MQQPAVSHHGRSLEPPHHRWSQHRCALPGEGRLQQHFWHFYWQRGHWAYTLSLLQLNLSWKAQTASISSAAETLALGDVPSFGAMMPDCLQDIHCSSVWVHVMKERHSPHDSHTLRCGMSAAAWRSLICDPEAPAKIVKISPAQTSSTHFGVVNLASKG